MAAVGGTPQRGSQYDWVFEFDIKGLFDNIDHERLLWAVEKHAQPKGVRRSMERWLKAPLQRADGTLVERTKGTPQGGVVSPVLANLFLHDAFEAWMGRTLPGIPWCRYADNGLVHGRTEHEAQAIRAALTARLAECGLERHPDKSRMGFCKDGSRKGPYPNTKFDFLGYPFRPRVVKNRKRNRLFVSFTPAVSSAAPSALRQKTRRLNDRNRTHLSLADSARHCPSARYPVFRPVNKTLVAWAMRKYRRLKGHKTRATLLMEGIAQRPPQLFVPWQRGRGGRVGLDRERCEPRGSRTVLRGAGGAIPPVHSP